jgi:hypothetical protein
MKSGTVASTSTMIMPAEAIKPTMMTHGKVEISRHLRVVMHCGDRVTKIIVNLLGMSGPLMRAIASLQIS